VQILSKAGEVCRITLPPNFAVSRGGKAVETKALPGGVVQFSTRKGERFSLAPK
jgi:hypothetical protein